MGVATRSHKDYRTLVNAALDSWVQQDCCAKEAGPLHPL